MSGTDPGDDPSLPLSQIERVVATCDRFEAACAPASGRGSRTTWATCPTRIGRRCCANCWHWSSCIAA